MLNYRRINIIPNRHTIYAIIIILLYTNWYDNYRTKWPPMRTTLNLDDQTLAEVMQLTGQKNRSEAVRLALQQYVLQQKKQQILAMRGMLDLESNWASLRNLDSQK